MIITKLPRKEVETTLGWVDFGHFFLRLKRGSANDFYEYNTPLDDLKFILSLKTADDQTFNCIAICKWESKIY